MEVVRCGLGLAAESGIVMVLKSGMIAMGIAASVMLAALWTMAAAAVETVRVDASSGAPRLMVDGKPVRARMFWGGPGMGPLPIGRIGRQVTLVRPLAANVALEFY